MPFHHTRDHFPQPWLIRQSRQPGKILAQAKLLLAVQGLFTAANALSGTFVNVYLWKVSHSLVLIGWFTLAHQIANVITFWFAGKWVKEHNKMNSLRLGVFMSAVFYLLVLLLAKQAVDYVFVLGLVQGMAAGFFWLAFNVVYFEITEPDNRDKFNGWAGLLNSGAGMFAPWISGIVITQFSNTTGYRLIFAISLFIFLIGVVISFFLKKRKALDHYDWCYVFRHLRENENPWRRALPALSAQGMREGVFTFIIGLLVYIATRNELQLGNYALITSAVALVSFMLAGKYLKPQLRSQAMLLGSVALIVVIFPFFWHVNYTTLLIFGIGTAIFLPLFVIPMTSTVFDFIGRDEQSALHRVEYVVARELALNSGRIAGTLLFIVLLTVTTKTLHLNLFILFIGCFPVVSWWFMRHIFDKTVNSDKIGR